MTNRVLDATTYGTNINTISSRLFHNCNSNSNSNSNCNYIEIFRLSFASRCHWFLLRYTCLIHPAVRSLSSQEDGYFLLCVPFASAFRPESFLCLPLRNIAHRLLLLSNARQTRLGIESIQSWKKLEENENVQMKE